MSKEETNPELDFERISVLYENTNVGYSGIAAGVLFFGYMIDQLASIQVAYSWMIAVGIAYIPRIIISVTFSRKMKAREITFENVKPWENYFSTAALFLSCVFPAPYSFPLSKTNLSPSSTMK